MKKDWSTDIRNKLDSYEAPVPDDLWDGIVSGLGPLRQSRRVLPVFRYAVAAAAVLVAFVAGYVWYGNQLQPDSAVADSGVFGVVSPVKAELLAEVRHDSSPEELVLYPRTFQTEMVEEVSPSGTGPENNGLPEAAGEDAGSSVPEISGDPVVAVENAETDGGTNGGNSISDSEDQEDWDATFREAAGQRGRMSGKFSTSVFGAGITGGRYEAKGYTDMAMIGGTKAMALGSSPLADMVVHNSNREVSTDTRHYQPVKVGVSFRYEFTRRWSVGTGLFYSCLISDFDAGSDIDSYSRRQQLHYIGIPVSLDFTAFDSRIADIYISAGGAVEKAVGGTSRTDYIHKGSVYLTENDRIVPKPLQWSVTASLGAQFNISPLVGIYFEPGAVYYFRNSSEVSSAYTDKPFNFNLNLGFRFSFR